MGKTYLGVTRTTFLVAADGTVAKVMHNVKPETHADDVLTALASA
jgi:peroxiredoxin Q/BCP